MKEAVLLHICCGPCSLYVVEELRGRGLDVVGYFYNPNIHPYMEYRKRIESLYKASQAMDYKLLVKTGYDIEDYFRAVASNEEFPVRCERCYELRLGRAAKMAKEKGLSRFTSTLFYSKYQDHDRMKRIAEKAAQDAGVEFLYIDFRKRWKEGVELSKKLGLYRQKYCGCLYSERERYLPEYRPKRGKSRWNRRTS